MGYMLTELLAEESEVVGRIEDVQSRVRYALESRQRWWAFLRRSELAQAIVGSTTMDGRSLSQEDAIAAVAGEPPLDSEENAWRAARGYRTALAYVSQLSGDPHFQHHEGFTRSIHFMMVDGDPSGNPGKWRREPIRVRELNSRRTRYTGPDAERVPGLMAEFMKDLNRAENKQPAVVKAALAQLHMETIRPFSEGNGRMARCFATLVMAREGKLDPGFCGVEEYLHGHAVAYRGVLERVGESSWSPRLDPRPWIRFYLTAQLQRATTLLGRIREAERLFNELDIEIEKRDLPPRSIFAAADAAMGRRVRNATYRSIAGTSWNVASRDLKLLVDSGLLVPRGERRGRFYEGSDIVRSLRARISQPDVQIEDPFRNTKEVEARGMFQALSRAVRSRLGGTTRS